MPSGSLLIPNQIGEWIFYLRWRWKYRNCIKKENAYRDFETHKKMYRFAAYCLNCKMPVMNYQSFCRSCDNQDTKLTGV